MSYLAPEPEPKSVTFQLRNVWNFADMSNLLDNSYMEYLFTYYFYNILWWSVVEGHRCSLWSEVKSTYPVRSVISVFELPTRTLISDVNVLSAPPSTPYFQDSWKEQLVLQFQQSAMQITEADISNFFFTFQLLHFKSFWTMNLR